MDLLAMKSTLGDVEDFARNSFQSSYITSSFSSSADSSYDPFTPNSGRSTPASLQHSLEVESSFCSQAEPLSYQLAFTPPPTAESKGFGSGLQPDNIADSLPMVSSPASIAGMPADYIACGLPTTNSPFGSVLEMTAGRIMYRTQSVPSPACIEFYASPEALTPSPYLVPAMLQQALPPMWPAEVDSVTSLLDTRELAAPLPTTRRVRSLPVQESNGRRPYERARPRTNAVQRAHKQRALSSQGHLAPRKAKPAGDGPDYEVVRKGNNPCHFPGCTKRFARKEHLKRHQKTTHGCSLYFKCWYCEQLSNRLDNWRDHLKRHTDPNKQTERLVYYEEAVVAYSTEMARVRESRKCKSKLPPNITIVKRHADEEVDTKER